MVASASAVDPHFARDAAGNTDISGKTPVYPGLTAGESTGVLIFAGQSLIANTVNALYTPANAKAHNLNFLSGGMYTAVDPQLGCDGFAGDGSAIGRILDKSITAGIWTRAIGVPCAVDGTLVAQWDVAGAYYWRFACIKSRLAALGLTATAICFELGTADTSAGTSQAAWTASFNSMVAGVRANGLTCPWLVAQSTIPGFAASAPAQAVRAAQAAVVTGTIYAGPDTDTAVPVGDRYDGTHDNATGADKRATAWKNSLDVVF